MTGLNVAANERETVRVFELDLDGRDAEAFATLADPWPLQLALGAERLDAEHIEAFPARDLKGVGLAAYLIDGYGIAAEDIAPDRDALDAAGPYIVLLRARAFGGIAQTLSPEQPLHHLGTYSQAKAETPHLTPTRKDGPAPDMKPTAPAEPAPSRGPLIALLIFLGGAVTLFLVLFLAKT